jgi:hypothetical protein
MRVIHGIGRVMAQAVSRRHLTEGGRICAWVVHVGFMVGKAEVGKVFSKFFSLTLSILVHSGSLKSIIWVMNKTPVSGRSSET